MIAALQILIEGLQKEHDFLENEMNLCIKDWDFLGAEAFRIPLEYMRIKLATLKNLENPNYDEINSLQYRIERINTFESKDKILKSVYEPMKSKIPEYEQELSKLENIKSRFHIDGEELIICFKKIIAGKLKRFEIEFSDSYI